MNESVCIAGAGTYGEVVLELCQDCGFNVSGFYDDDSSKIGQEIAGIPVKGPIDIEEIAASGVGIVVAIGNNKIRCQLCSQLARKGVKMPSLVHPKAVVSKSARVGDGCLVHCGSFLWTNVSVGNYVIVSPNVVVAHHSTLEEASFISTGSNIGASVRVNTQSFIGIGATIMTGVKTIGQSSVIGAGSVVIRDVEEVTVVAGVPARVIKRCD